MRNRVDDAARYIGTCVEKEMPLSDDRISDARTVALTLALRCQLEYDNFTDAYGLANLDNDVQRRMFSSRRSQDAEKIRAFLPWVMEYRAKR